MERWRARGGEKREVAWGLTVRRVFQNMMGGIRGSLYLRSPLSFKLKLVVTERLK